MNNMVGWFEIPVTDMERAIKFYSTVFSIELQRNKLDGLDMAWFPFDEKGLGSSGSLVYHPEFYKPSTDGTLIYFTPRSGNLAVELAKVEAAGGKVLESKKLISEDIGYMGLFLDSEGNRIAIHSRK
ncbi:MAG: VOC family protein [Lentimicrobiaceae bacterium]|nr:VOC family protein [Lentimicrobiaceae bacterium]MCB9023322.1 VOC family protein [Lentimicrobiaceae bacterium]MCO5265729.1 VOC family protein [Lentimicrobium sp.]